MPTRVRLRTPSRRTGGICTGTRTIPAGVACLFMHGRHARVESVGIVEAFRGRGFVRPLLRRVQEEAKIRGCASLWVFPIDDVAKRIYKKCGFQTCGYLESAHAYKETESFSVESDPDEKPRYGRIG
ncbi:GNAT family N-acetyltransferase [Alicyclobacillus herbarius]|nr:GNAT family N-acetyltransferase [Alicyclobacillus herbarius]